MGAQDNRPNRLVLVVDDVPELRHIYELALASAGVTALPAASGEEAVAKFGRHHEEIELVLLDVRLAGNLDGPGTLLALQKIDPKVRCCFVTAGGGHDDARLLALGAVRVFPKPFRLDEFLDEIGRLLGRRAAETDSRANNPPGKNEGTSGAGPAQA
jgi:DNA-binding NtrC family response regulator